MMHLDDMLNPVPGNFNPELEQPFDNNGFLDLDLGLGDSPDFDFGSVDAAALSDSVGYTQSQTLLDHALAPVLETNFNYIRDAANNRSHLIDEDALTPSNTQSQTTSDNLSSESSGVLSRPESQVPTTPPSSDNTPLEGEQICYGMIYHVDVKLTDGDMAKLDALLNGCRETPRSNIQRFKLQAKSEHVILLLPDGTNFGYLRDNITKVLTPLLHREELEFEAVATSHSLHKKLSRINKASEAIVQVDINIYGPPEKGEEIGATLSKAKAWLQKPGLHKKNVAYENPHVIKFPGIGELPESEISRSGARNAGIDQIPDIEQVIRDVESNTHRAAGLERAKADMRLQTQLLEHQETALTFMLQRESGDIPSEFRLWQPETTDGRESFVHRITKSRSNNLPEESGGGILADEMGMGKSLSILSLLLKTTEEAKKWVEERNSEDLTHSGIESYAKSTLIIVPSALLINSWMKEIDLHLGNAVKVTKYHGDGRERKTKILAKSDIVLTTYKTLATDYLSKKHITSPLHSIGWFRIVLDEAHNIRRPATTYYKTCVALTARSRWCLSGTPIQNRLEDIGALLAFLRVDQFTTLARFRWYLVHPYDEGKKVAIERLVMIYDSIVLRRTKDVLVLPGQVDRIRELELSPAERMQYKETEMILNRSIRQFIGEHEVATKFGLFQAHLQLRIFCNHGTHQRLFSWKKNQKMAEEAMLIEAGLGAHRACTVCRQPEPTLASTRAQDIFKNKCHHVFCQECLEAAIPYAEQENPGLQPSCPLCELGRKPRKRQRTGRATHDSEDVVMREANDEDTKNDDGYFDHNGHSTKMEALVTDVKETLDETVAQENGERQKAKSIIFSCWTRTLNLIEIYLKKYNIEFLRVDGEMLMSKRQRILDLFSQPGGPQIMLMTTGTGAFGLNLTAANRIFIVELQWNPSVEYQAIARAIRLRQKDKVIVTRYFMKNTVEQDMRNQQETKKRAARAGFEEKDKTDRNS